MMNEYWPFYGLLQSAFWIGLLVFMLTRRGRYRGYRPGENGSKSALEILNERYAKGEIEKAEFDEKKKDIG